MVFASVNVLAEFELTLGQVIVTGIFHSGVVKLLRFSYHKNTQLFIYFKSMRRQVF